MTEAVTAGIIVDIVAIILAVLAVVFLRKNLDNLLGAFMIVAVMLTVSAAFYHVEEFPEERAERARKLLVEEGYGLTLAGTEVNGTTLDPDVFSVVDIDDENWMVHLEYNPDSPDWIKF